MIVPLSGMIWHIFQHRWHFVPFVSEMLFIQPDCSSVHYCTFFVQFCDLCFSTWYSVTSTFDKNPLRMKFLVWCLLRGISYFSTSRRYILSTKEKSTIPRTDVSQIVLQPRGDTITKVVVVVWRKTIPRRKLQSVLWLLRKVFCFRLENLTSIYVGTLSFLLFTYFTFCFILVQILFHLLG